MMDVIENLNFFLALGGVLLFLAAALLVVDLKTSRTLSRLMEKWGAVGAFIVVSTGGILSLIYSEVLGFTPCGLCWMQRIFLYPQVFILGMAFYTKDKLFPKYGIALSIPGLFISLYHHYIQMGGAELITCPTSAANCASRTIFEFGFMTFPLISASLFVFLIALYSYLIVVRARAVLF